MRIDLVEKAEELVREQNMGNYVGEIASAVSARVSLGMGINLENTCPFLRECTLELRSSANCVSPENYRKMPCYANQMTLNVLSGRLDSLMPELLEVAN